LAHNEITLPRPAALPGQLGWISYEMAGGPYYQLIRIFVFAPYFAAALVGDKVRGQEIWGYVEGASGFAVAVLAAPLGAMVEAYGPRKPGIAFFSAVFLVGLSFLWYGAPGAPVLPIATALVVAAAAIEYAYAYHSSLLGLITPPGRIGLLSGLGYSGSYLGTLIVIIPWLIFIANAKVLPFGLDRAAAEDVRIVAPLAAAWFFVCAVPFFALTPDVPRRGISHLASIGQGLAKLRRTIVHARHYGNIVRYLVSRMVYYDGLVATYTFTGVFASALFGWSAALIAVYGLIVISVLVFAGILGGLLDDRIGSKRTILIGLVMTMSSLAFSVGLGPDHILYVVPIDAKLNAAGLAVVGGLFSVFGFSTLTEQVFVLSTVVGGIFLGPALASSRTLLARLAPTTMMAEFFGLYTLTGKATSFIAPLAIALVTRLTHDVRAGFAVVIAFIFAGFVGLLTVREQRAVGV
jgi:UMF1 family MFS transporter